MADKNTKNRTRAGNGKGSFRKLKSGKYEYRISYKDEFGEIRRKSFTAETKAECYSLADEFRGVQKKKKRGVKTEETICSIMQEKLKNDLEKNYIGEQGYCRNLGNLKIIEKSILGKKPIRKITFKHIDFFLKTITKYSDSVIGKIYSQLKTAFRLAYHKGIINNNLMQSPELRQPKSDKPPKKIYSLTEEEQKCLLDYLDDYKQPYGRNNYSLQLIIELLTGMRMGEINALKPEHIDFRRKEIHVRSTVSRGKNYRDFIKDGTKTTTGIRDIPMSKTVEKYLRRALDNMKENPEGLVFYDYNKNGIISTYQVNLFYQRTCKKCNIEYYGQHSLRHTFATRCIEADVSPDVLKRWLGHKSIQVTLDTYADVFAKRHNSAMDKFDKYMESF